MIDTYSNSGQQEKEAIEKSQRDLSDVHLEKAYESKLSEKQETNKSFSKDQLQKPD
jgi:hypothetical protein